MTLREQVHAATDWLKRVATQPRSELTRWQAAARFAYDLGRYGAKQLRDDRAGEMAAALSFRTLFAIFPMVVVGAAFFQGLRGVERFHELVRELIERAGLAGVEIQDAPAVEPGEQQELGSWIEDLIFQIGDVNLETLGWIGLAVVIYAAIAMMVTIEETFNLVYRAPEGRAWVRRVPVYWTVLTMGLIVIWLILFIDARFAEWVGEVAAVEWARAIVRTVWGFVIIWLVLFGMYMLVPNTAVAWKPAMVGAFVAGLGVHIGKELLAGYIATFLTIQQLYGAIGFIPLLMFWVYVMWLVILFGLEVSSTLQSLGGRRNMEEMEAKRPRTGMLDPASILLVMEVIGECFQEGKPASTRRISEKTGIPANIVTEMIERLCEAGLVHRLERDENAATLARPPEQISADRLIEVGFAMVDELAPGRKSQLIERLREAERDLASNATLASLLTVRQGQATAEDRLQNETH